MSSASRLPLEGRMLGEFMLRDKIGEGGFATVHRAYQAALEREAVVKVLHAQLANRTDVIQRFLRESRLASRLDHPYAAHVYAFGAEPDGTLWIAMELVRGTPMDKLLEQQGPLSIDRFVPLFERICEVVQTAHERGIVHRDLKPGNVMVLSRAGRLLPKLLDFGIARVIEETHGRTSGVELAFDETVVDTNSDTLAGGGVDAADTKDDVRPTRAGAVMGSPLYMAPEQWADAGSVGQAADIYALGVIAYEALTGRMPYKATTVQEVMIAHATEEALPLGAGLEVLDPVIRRALAKQPEDRYATAGDLAAAMRAATGRGDADVLPELEEPVRVAMAAGAPQPLAEAVAALEAARNIDQACALIWDVVAVTARWIGALALAARTKIGPGSDRDGRDAIEQLRKLGRGDLDDEGWLGLATALTRPFFRRRDAHPIPDVVTLLHGDVDLAAETPPEGAALEPGPAFVEAFHRLRTLRATLDRRAGKSDEQRRELYAEALVALAELLRPLRFLLDYTLVVTRNRCAERWRGIRRTPRPAMIRRARPLPEGEVFLVDGDGQPVLALAPLVQATAPSPGRDDELFVFAGRGPHGGRLVAVPFGFELHDPSIDEWFREHLLDLANDRADAPVEEAAPYRGLAAFTAADSGFYFGREREIDTFLNRLRVEAFLAVVGPSGAGKSSFVQAGVIPRLPTSWRAIVVRPGPSPAATLEARLERNAVESTGLAADPRALGDRLRAAATREGTTIVLVVDQLEELFTLCRDPEERARYVEALAGAARADDDPVRVIVTLRDDFLIRAEAAGPLRERLGRGIKLLATPAAEDLERIVVEPARRVGYQFEDRALAGEMVAAVAGQPGALALLSFTAAELWKLRDRHFHQLSRKSYAAIGGVVGALARHAEDTLAELSSDEHRLAREAFRHLVTAEGTRQVLQRAELRQLLARDDRGDAVVDKLVAARLVVVSEEAGGDDRVEIIHEALLDAWPRLVEWRREDSEGARLRDQLRAAAKQWDSRGRPRGLLWRAEALAEYQIWRARYPGALTDLETAFGGASVADATRGKRIRRSLLGAAFAILAVGAFVMFQLRQRAEEQRAVADEQRGLVRAQLVDSWETHGRQALATGNYAEALVYFDAVRTAGTDRVALDLMLARTTEPFTAQITSLRGHEGQIWSIAFSPDETRLLTAASDGTARIWNRSTGAEVARLAGHTVGWLLATWSPDGRHVATVDSAGALRLWTAAGMLDGVLASTAITFPVFTPDSTRIVGAGSTIRIFDVASRRELAAWKSEQAEVLHAAFDRDERLLTVGDVGPPRLWSRTHQLLATFEGHTDGVWFARFDPTGSRIVTNSLDGTARIWRTSDGRQEHVLDQHVGRVTYATFDASGTRVLTTGADRTIRLWKLHDTAPVKLLATMHGHTGQVNRAAFAADGTIVSVGADGTARAWDERGVQIATFSHPGMVFDCAISADGETLATSSWVGTSKLWKLKHGNRAAHVDVDEHVWNDVNLLAVADRGGVLRVHPRHAVWWSGRGARAVEVTPPSALLTAGTLLDGDRFVLADGNGELHVFRGATRVSTTTTGLGAIGAITAIDTGTIVAVGNVAVEVWDIARGTRLATRSLPPRGRDRVEYITATERITIGSSTHVEIVPLDLSGGIEIERGYTKIMSVKVSPSNDVIAIAEHNRVDIWSVDGALIHTFRHQSEINDTAWVGNHRLVTAGTDGTLSVLDVDARSTERVRAHDLFVRTVALGPDGLLASGAGDGTVSIWEPVKGGLKRLYAFSIGSSIHGMRWVDDRVITLSASSIDAWRMSTLRGSNADITKVLCRLPVRFRDGRLEEVDPTCD